MKKIALVLLIVFGLLIPIQGYAATPSDLVVTRDHSSNTAISINAETYVNNISLVANTGQTYTFYSTTSKILLSCNGDVWVLFGGTSSVNVPSSNTTNGTGLVLNPQMRQISIAPFTTMGIVSASATLCSVSEWQ